MPSASYGHYQSTMLRKGLVLMKGWKRWRLIKPNMGILLWAEKMITAWLLGALTFRRARRDPGNCKYKLDKDRIAALDALDFLFGPIQDTHLTRWVSDPHRSMWCAWRRGTEKLNLVCPSWPKAGRCASIADVLLRLIKLYIYSYQLTSNSPAR